MVVARRDTAKTEANDRFNFLPIRLCFINVYNYPNPKPTPYNNGKTEIIVVQCDKKYTILMCTCPVDKSVNHLALTLKYGVFRSKTAGLSNK